MLHLLQSIMYRKSWIKFSSKTLDRAGMCTSFICIIHCLALPLLFLFGIDSLLWWVDSHFIEWSIIVVSFLIGSTAFFLGYRQHKLHHIPVLFFSGFLLLVNGESVLVSWQGIALSVAGALVIAYAHFQNLKSRKDEAVS